MVKFQVDRTEHTAGCHGDGGLPETAASAVAAVAAKASEISDARMLHKGERCEPGGGNAQTNTHSYQAISLLCRS